MSTRKPPGKSSSQSAFAAGAARASGERAKRRATPLISVVDEGPTPTAPTPAPRVEATPGRHRPQPTGSRAPVSPKAASRSGSQASTARTARVNPSAQATRPLRSSVRRVPVGEPTLRAVPDVSETGSVEPTDARPVTPDETGGASPDIVELLTSGIRAMRAMAIGAGLAPEDADQQVARILAFLRRRLTGDYTIDAFGFDEDFTVNAYLPLLRPLYKRWFRVEVRGIENIPSEGGALVVANHSGTIAMDSLMTQVAVYDEHPARRHLRMLGADLVFSTPIFGQVARSSGSTLATNPDAERLLSGGELVGVWPEGFKGVGKPYSERYKLQRFGRGGFVAAAVRTGVPIIPCSIVGAEEIYPMIGNLKPLARLVGAPYAPITPTWPLLGPLGLIPLPSKWIMQFGAPVETASLGSNAADDAMLVFDLTDQIRETIQQTLYSLLMARRSIFT